MINLLLSGGIAEDRENYTLLLELLHKELSKRGRILSGAVPANLYTINKAYEIEEMCKLVVYYEINLIGDFDRFVKMLMLFLWS